MNEHRGATFPDNPFSSRRVRPGALPFLFAGKDSVGKLVGRLRENGWWGQIVGPHGSGKSTLLAMLLPAIEQAGQSVLRIELHDRCWRLPDSRGDCPDFGGDCPNFRAAKMGLFPSVNQAGRKISAVSICDGFQQLGRWQRFRLKRFCRRARLGLLVTAHLPVGLPDLCHTATSLPLARQIVEQLQRDYRAYVTEADVAEHFSRRGGDLRETLFDLYDLYEARRRRASAEPP